MPPEMQALLERMAAGSHTERTNPMATTKSRIYPRAVKVFEGKEKAKRWMEKPCRALGNVSPISLLDSPTGVQAVEDELERIARTVYC